jgi:hypothetical protein
LIFQNKDEVGEGEDVYAPVVDRDSLRVFFTVVATRGWYLEQSDIKTAFLNAEAVGEHFVRLPAWVVPEGESAVRLLNKALYGLRSAPKAWNTTFSEWAVDAGFQQFESEECLFFHKEFNALIVIYVDDLLVGAESLEGIRGVQRLLDGKFQVRHMGQPSFFLGMNVEYDREHCSIVLSQQTYVMALRQKYQRYVGLQRSLPMVCGIVLNKEQGEMRPTDAPYSSLVGALLFLAVCTRPDISYAVGTLSKFISNPGEEHWGAAVDVLSYLVATMRKGIKLGRNSGEIRPGLVAYADSDWANDTDDRRSVSGGALFIDGNLVSWLSKKQNMVCTSTAEAEVHAIMEMVHRVAAVKSLVGELGRVVEFFLSNQNGGSIPVILSDNQPGLDAIQAKRGRSKHYDIKVKFIAESVQRGEFLLQKIPSSANLADVFTKPLRRVRFQTLTGFFMHANSK